MSPPTTQQPSIDHNIWGGLPKGTVVAERFIVEGPLGSGGFATVYRATQQGLNRSVALKILELRVDRSPTFAERFRQEAQIAAGLNHPNIVSIYDYGIIDSTQQPYIAMELLEGRTLDDELDTYGEMSLERVAALMIPCLDALGEGHLRGIIHKDLKPSNLFVVHPHHPIKEALVVTDYGIARIQAGEGQGYTETGQFLGTPQYLAPEYLKGEGLDTSCDVYQMGLIVVEMLSAKAVVDHDETYPCMMAHMRGDLNIPEHLMQGPLGTFIRRSTCLDRTARFRDAHAMRDAFQLLISTHSASKVSTATATAHTHQATPPSSQSVSSEGPQVSTGFGTAPTQDAASLLAAPARAQTPVEPSPRPGAETAVAAQPQIMSSASGVVAESVSDTNVGKLESPPTDSRRTWVMIAGVLAVVLVMGTCGLMSLVAAFYAVNREHPESASRSVEASDTLTLKRARWSKGDTYTQSETIHQNLRTALLPSGMVEQHTMVRRFTVQATRKNIITKVRVDYTQKLHEASAADGDSHTTSPLEGRSYIVKSSKKGGFTVRSVRGKKVPTVHEGEVRADYRNFGEGDAFDALIPERPIAVGEQFRPPRRAAAKTFGLEEPYGKLDRFVMTLERLDDLGDMRVAVFGAELHFTWRQEDEGVVTTTTKKLAGPVTFDIDTGRLLSVHIDGPVKVVTGLLSAEGHSSFDITRDYGGP